MESMVDFSVVIPVYKNYESLGPLLNSLDIALGKLPINNEVIFVIDGSPDSSFEWLRQNLPLKNANSILVDLSRNFGSIAAVRTGMSKASGSIVTVMAADLQESPDLLLEFYNSLADETTDIAIGKRLSRNDPRLSKWLSKVYWSFYRKTINPEIPVGGVDIFACTKKAKDQIVAMNESSSSLIGLVYWVGFSRTYVDYERAKRPYGKSAWTFGKKFRYFTDSIFAFSHAPIVLLQSIGFFGIAASILVGSITLFGALTDRISSPGYPSLLVALLFSTSSILLGLGIVGDYAWRAFENTKMRPLSIVKNEYKFQKDESKQ
jgi:glycosyltransferase involved in cell wall biosynthesis